MGDTGGDSECVESGVEATPPKNPLDALQEWLGEARASGVPAPSSVAFVTVGADGRPSARTVSLKRLDAYTLTFTSALWT